MVTGGGPFRVRAVTPEDEPAILEVYRACEDFLALGPVPTASMAMVLQDLETSRREGGTYLAIFGTEGKMIGVVDYIPGGFEGKSHIAFLSLLMIALPFRRRGVGTAVVDLVEREIRKNPQVYAIQSAVQANNPSALQFWLKNGYAVVGGPEFRPDKTTVYRLQKAL
jgi:ribosomal protein S18 acetylase RimI-like enzyme